MHPCQETTRLGDFNLETRIHRLQLPSFPLIELAWPGRLEKEVISNLALGFGDFSGNAIISIVQSYKTLHSTRCIFGITDKALFGC